MQSSRENAAALARHSLSSEHDSRPVALSTTLRYPGPHSQRKPEKVLTQRAPGAAVAELCLLAPWGARVVVVVVVGVCVRWEGGEAWGI